MVLSVPVQLLCPLYDLLLISFVGFLLIRYFSLGFVAKIGFCDSHFAHGSECAQPKVAIVHHLDCQFHRLWSEIHYQSISFEITFVVLVQFNPRLPGIDFLCNDATFGKDMVDLILGRIERYRCDIYSCIDALLFRFQSGLPGFW